MESKDPRHVVIVGDDGSLYRIAGTELERYRVDPDAPENQALNEAVRTQRQKIHPMACAIAAVSSGEPQVLLDMSRVREDDES